VIAGVKFKSRNVLDDNDLREGIKKFSNWPTIPQLYVKGEFVGGCDVLWQAHEAGEFEALVKRSEA
jgi:monothiol glutaredoxin